MNQNLLTFNSNLDTRFLKEELYKNIVGFNRQNDINNTQYDVGWSSNGTSNHASSTEVIRTVQSP